MSARVEYVHGALVYGLDTDTGDVLVVSQDLFLFVEQALALVEQLVVFGEDQVDFTLCLFALEVEGVEVVEGGLGLIERMCLLGEVVTVDFLVEGVASAVEV